VGREESTGYVFRDADGSLYLLREEVLEACRIEGADLEFAHRFAEEQSGDGFQVTEGPFTDYTRIDDTCATHPFDVCEPRPAAPSTLMCAW
jgi:hypothetical protein